jgi:single-strand DNA-binding protein
MNNVVLIGRLTRDPELRYLEGSGTSVSNFTLAIDRQLSKEKKAEAESKGYPTADFINIVVWGKQAENCVNYLVKGRLVAVNGRLQSRSYDAKDGTKRYVTEVVANNVQFLEWGDNNSDNKSNDFDDIDGFTPVDDSDIPF